MVLNESLHMVVMRIKMPVKKKLIKDKAAIQKT
jgi:hypothetical protein